MADDVDDIRERKLRELKEHNQVQDEQSNQEEDVDSVLRGGLTDDARQRLNALEMAKPQRAKSVKRQLAAILQRGQIDTPITEDQVKKILKKVSDSESKDFDIKRR